MEVLLIFVLVVALIVVGVIVYNDLNPLWHKLDEAKANIEVVMHKRTQLTNRLVEVAGRYVGHEQMIHLQISADRARAGQAANAGMGPTGQAMTFFTGLAASFPDLKADQTYRQLMGDLTVLETEVQNRYEVYNNNSKEYNARRTSLPNYIFASTLGFEQAKYLDPSLWYSNSPQSLRIPTR
jgi:LemA protein